jgi:hypothetical protein
MKHDHDDKGCRRCNPDLWSDAEKYEMALDGQRMDREFKGGDFCWVPNLEDRFPRLTDQQIETLREHGKPLLDLLSRFAIYAEQVEGRSWQLRRLSEDEIDELHMAAHDAEAL